MTLDGKALSKALRQTDAPLTVHNQLCRAQIEAFNTAAADGTPLVVGCTQEAPLFRETLDAAESATPAAFVNIREQAGWSDEGGKATAKIAALLAEATLDLEPAPSVTMTSDGTCLVYGRDETAIEAARQLAGRLDVTLLLTGTEPVIPPASIDLPIFKGRISAARGHLGAFEIVVDEYAPYLVSSRQSFVFDLPRNGAASECDLILDLSGSAPLFPAHERRDGYFRPDPGNPAAVQKALFELSDMVGSFEKPRYVDFNESLCAHSRSGITGCTRCLDLCPASAIQPDGDHVAIDPFLCGGCGACNSVCPTGAASYTMPTNQALLQRLRSLMQTYAGAGGRRATLLAHDPRHGLDLVYLVGRLGRGLPADVVPFAVNEVTQLGFDVLAGALAYGAARVLVLVPPQRREEADGLRAQAGIVRTMLDGLGYDAANDRVQILEIDDPEALDAALHDLTALDGPKPGEFLPMGGKRSQQRLILQHLHATAPASVDTVPLPAGAPFGRVKVDVEGCTLCLSCVGACPTGALQDNPDQPMLRFQEDSCIQCGLCQRTCPESVIELEPRLNFTDQATSAAIIKQEEPAHCVRCGKPFGTKSSVERIVAKLAEKHSMFQNPAAVERIRMCEDCRVIAQFEATDNPFATGEAPRTRSTADYLREREEMEAARATVKANGDDDA
jgi:ferredoxin